MRPSPIRWSRLLFAILMVLITLPPAVADLAQPTVPLAADGGPAEAEVRLNVNKIYEIDTVNETYLVDGYLNVHWSDERLAFQPAEGEPDKFLYEDDAVEAQLGGRVWWPTLEFINVVGSPDVTNRALWIHENGRITYDERFHAKFTSADMDFRKYPFDTQKFTVQIESFSFEEKDVLIVKPRAFPEKPEDMDRVVSSEWTVQKMRAFVTTRVYEHTLGQGKYSRYNLEITAKRNPEYFIWQLFVPLFLIIAASWIVFWISDFADQLATAFTLLLTVVAFNFYTSTLLPKLPYNTFIEIVIMSGYVAIFLATVMIVAGHVVTRRGREETAERLMLHSRWLFPVGYAVSLGLLAVRFLG